MKSMVKGYSQGPFGQLHWRMMEPSRPRSTKPDLYCLHPAPFSGLAFTNIMPHLARGRRVIAPDYPGHGGSDSFKADALVTDYAAAMLSLVEHLSSDRPVDLMGFHTGCLVAVEMAVEKPNRIGRLALVDVPAFEPETRTKLLSRMGKPFEICPELNCLEAAWDLGVTKRVESQGPDRSFEMFVEQLRHGRGMNAAFHAGFSYDVDRQLQKVTQPVLIFASQSGLLEPSRRAAEIMPTASLLERLDIKRAVLDESADITAREVSYFLDF